jgi:tRNA pseudouridine55 synthase
LTAFRGEIAQVPPAFSAAHVAGRRAYQMARKGEAVELAARRVTVHRIEVRAYEYPVLDLTVECGKGTYIRSLARDLGEHLGCGAFVETLRRTRIGEFTIDAAVSGDGDAATARRRLLPPSAALVELPRLELEGEEVARLRCGQRIFPRQAIVPREPEEVVVFGPDGVLMGVAAFVDLGQLKAVKVFAPGIWPPAEEV